jgi:hypothetical protein
MGGVIFPGRDHPAASGISSGYLLATVTAANPYSIPGLYESAASVSVVRGGWWGGLDWERTAISGFSRDCVELSAGPALPGGDMHISAILRTESCRVTGYGSETVFSTRWSFSLGVFAVVFVEMEAGTSPYEKDIHATTRVGQGGNCMVLTLGRDSRREDIARAGGTIRVAGRHLLLAGFDLGTGEVSGGLMIRGPALAAASWSLHPVLGATFSVSIGAVR